MLNLLIFIWKIPRNTLILFIRLYQLTLSPLIGRSCRFHPTCSNYGIQALKKYGFCLGTIKGIWRVLRCNPFCRGGEDEP